MFEFKGLWVVYDVLRLARILGGFGCYHPYFLTQERADTGQGQGLRMRLIWFGIGKPLCGQVRVRTRARF